MLVYRVRAFDLSFFALRENRLIIIFEIKSAKDTHNFFHVIPRIKYIYESVYFFCILLIISLRCIIENKKIHKFVYLPEARYLVK